ncbi:Surface polysaccharide O-acyltransferase, integral membrane enzyme [Carnobacterium iners]|uniref:Surface polysaccharide O-acyltransferase, integral membrane enzyme n=1 Tax=Carnobacterium iners TaxID=1073423 RepID=A0A1X7MPT4_9LACT|nr:acyltransferase family protein [Carnobacterium iners]SEK94046.1 Surface polysaccharide O-acyltransferase, integral membrane enzyme [Carnobacterium iners]SMH26705.1 Surface polysaccharide O-acyltransferase, integral membrane enzyme [Carnobacterium iners]
MVYNRTIDVMKGLAILFVIFIHSLTNQTVLDIGGPFYILQAVPLFLVIAGFNNTMSYERHHSETLIDLYQPILLLKKLNRILLPAVLAYLFQLVIGPFIGEEASIFFYLFGRGGFGGFFISIMIQLIFFLPFLYYLAKRNHHLMLLISFLVNLGFELASDILDLPPFLYRLFFFRYLFAIALGIWFYFIQQDKKALTIIKIGAFLSILYLILVHYFDYNGSFYSFDTAWRGQNPLTFFYPLFLFHLGLTYLPKLRWNILYEGLACLGKQSYHIFIVQMVYFWVIASYIDKTQSILVIDLASCLIIGSAYYHLEKFYFRHKKHLR